MLSVIVLVKKKKSYLAKLAFIPTQVCIDVFRFIFNTSKFVMIVVSFRWYIYLFSRKLYLCILEIIDERRMRYSSTNKQTFYYPGCRLNSNFTRSWIMLNIAFGVLFLKEKTISRRVLKLSEKNQDHLVKFSHECFH